VTKFFIYSFIALGALIPLLTRSETTVVYKGQMPTSMVLEITKIEWDSLDVINLYTRDGRAHELICGFNPWYGESRSRLEYKNQYRARVAQFHFDDHSCLHLFNFSKAAFEGVDSEHSVKLEIDIKNGKVAKIILPDLNYFEAPATPPKTEQLARLP